MRQNAVSSAPQNDAPIHTLASSANSPKLVEEPRIRSSAPAIVDFAVVGNRVCRSASTRCSSRSLSSTWPATKSPSRASGRIDSSRLYATMAERPVRLSS
jgi:hypothetical protein